MLKWRREERRERRSGCKLIAGFDTTIKKFYERDK
jgi:hypothetical protein